MMRPTKNDMARVIVQALYNMPHLPAKGHGEVVRRATKNTASTLAAQYKMALDALHSKERADLERMALAEVASVHGHPEA